MREVRYGAYAIEVPASWPVYDLAADPSRCVRFDRHAVYLGRPGTEQRCPAHAVGRTETISIEPMRGAGSQTERGNTMRSAVPSAGVLVSATWRRDRGLVRRILDGARRMAGNKTPSSSAPPPGNRAPQAVPGDQLKASTPAPYFTGLGFDACTAPSTSAMSAWRSSQYRAVGIYIGGANMGCSQPNLSAGWVGQELGSGWRLTPIYVGLQAPGSSCPCATIRYGRARAQGRTAADDATSDARAVGLGAGAPIYFDLEAYARSAHNSAAVLRFLSGWTRRLHSRGYVSGVYSSAASGIRDLAGRYGTGYSEPDDIWIANWNGRRTTDDPYVPDRYWSDHQRLHQYQGGHVETHGGVSINVDSNYLDGAVVGGTDRDRDGVPDFADLCRTVRGPVENSGCPYPSYVSGELKGYYGFVKGEPHYRGRYATTAGVGAEYRFRRNLGFLYPSSRPGTIPIFSCRVGGDRFLSRDSDCDGRKVIAKLGYAFASSPPAAVPAQALYSCRRKNGERFVSSSSDCGSPRNRNLGLLGFTIAASPLIGYRGGADGTDGNATTAAVGAAYRFQRNLGFVYRSSQPGTIPLYGCRSVKDHFLSTSSDCGGARLIGRVGYAYASPPLGLPTRSIFSCREAGANGDLAVSYDPTCGGAPNVNEGPLGFTISTAPLGSYKWVAKGDSRFGDRNATTGRVGGGYRFVSNLGFLYQTPGSGTVPLYSCRAHEDHFLSLASDCDGKRVIARIGYGYASKPEGIPTQTIFSCRQAGGERFVAMRANCGSPRNTNTGLLGFTLANPLVG